MAFRLELLYWDAFSARKLLERARDDLGYLANEFEEIKDEFDLITRPLEIRGRSIDERGYKRLYHTDVYSRFRSAKVQIIHYLTICYWLRVRLAGYITAILCTDKISSLGFDEKVGQAASIKNFMNATDKAGRAIKKIVRAEFWKVDREIKDARSPADLEDRIGRLIAGHKDLIAHWSELIFWLKSDVDSRNIHTHDTFFDLALIGSDDKYLGDPKQRLAEFSAGADLDPTREDELVKFETQLFQAIHAISSDHSRKVGEVLDKLERLLGILDAR